MNYRIAPSILSADFARLGEEVRALEAAGADLIHFDVMDNHYVPNLTIGPLVCGAIRPHLRLPIDVHLMVKPVDRIVADFAKAGANLISFHPEASEHVDRTIALIRECGCKAGLVFNPATPLAWLDHTLHNLDLVRFSKNDPRLDVAIHGYPDQSDRLIVFIANPSAQAINAEVGLNVSLKSVKEIWEERPVQAGNRSWRDALPAYTIKIYECTL